MEDNTAPLPTSGAPIPGEGQPAGVETSAGGAVPASTPVTPPTTDSAVPAGNTWSSSVGGFTPTDPSPSPAATGPGDVIAAGGQGFRSLGQIVTDTGSPSGPAVTPPPPPAPTPNRPKVRRGLGLGTRAKLIASGVAAAVVVVASVGAILFLHGSGASHNASLNNAKNYTVTSIPLQTLSKNGALSLDQAAQLDINGQLRINNSLVLTPTGTPTNPQDGQIYLNNQTQQLFYYNGQSFVDLATGKEIGSIGKTTPGAGLAINGNQLNNTGVLSLQGQAGAVALTGGNGISINGLAISYNGAAGINGIFGTPNQISVVPSGSTVTLSLPQDIATGSAPTFASISVPTLTARPGDTGLVVGSNTQDLTLQGANTTISDTVNGNTAQIVFANPTASHTLIVPDFGGTICTTAGNCTTAGAITLQPTSPGSQQTGNANISGTFIAGAFSGDGTNLTNVNAAKLGGQLPSFYAASGANADINSLTALSSITPSSGLTIGASDQPLFLQGSAASTFSVTDSGFTTSLEFATPTSTAAIVVPNTSGTVAVKASGPLQLNAAGNLSCPNCLVSGGSGTAGVVSVNNFTGAITVAAGTGLGLANNSGLITIAADQDISQSAIPTFGGLLLNGQLGVGVSTPSFPVDVSGDVNVSGTYRINGNTICTSGGCTATGGSGNYIQNGTTLQSANLAIQGISASSPVALIKGDTGQSANIFIVQNSAGTTLLSVTAGGQVGVATGSPNYPLDVNGDINTNGALRVNGVAVCSSGTGCAPSSGSNNYIQNTTTLQVANFAVQSASPSSVGGVVRGAASQTADVFQVQNSGGASLLSVGPAGNTYVAGKLGVANASPTYQLDVSGDVNTTGVYRIGGVAICTSSGCTASGGSGSYIQNGTTIQSANIAIQSTSASSVGEVVQGAASQTADIFDVQDSAGDNLFNVTPAGNANIAASLAVGTVASPTYTLEVGGDANITGDYRINGQVVCSAAGCAAAGGAGGAILNTTTLQSANFNIQSAAATTSPTAVIRQANSQTGDLIDLEASNASIVAAINTAGRARFGGATSFTSTLNVGTNTGNAAGGITFGSDTDLYRSAASTLTTDGTFQAGEFVQNGADFSTGLALQSNTPGSTRSTNLTFTDDQATPQSISLRKEGNNLAVLDNSGNVQMAFNPASAELLFGSSLDTDLYRSAANSLTTDGSLTVGGTFTASGPSVFKDTSNGTATFEVQNSSGANVLVADTQDRRVGIDTVTPPSYPLDVNGDVNTSGVYRVGGTKVCDSTGCVAAPNSSYYIQNGTSVQSANFAIQSASASSVAGLLEGAASQTANIFQVQDSTAAILDQINAAGALSVQSTSANGALNIGTNSSTTASAGLYFGTDTDLYRTGTGALQTDGTFTATGNIIGSASVNAVTGINTGAGSGTQRIDGSGNLVNIGNVTTSGASTFTTTGATGFTFRPGTDTTTAFNIQNAAGSTNLFVADTNNSKIGIGAAPSSGGSILQVTGSVTATTSLISNGQVILANTGTNAGQIQKQGTAGSGGVTQNDVVVMNSSAQVVDTTTARDPRIYGVAASTAANGATANVTIAGNASVIATGPISIGDQLVTSTTSGRVVADNAATTGILGTALSALASGNGTVSVEVRPVNGQSTPIFSPQSNSSTAFQIQNANRSSTVFDADTSNIAVGIAGASTTAGFALNVTGTINASAGIDIGGSPIASSNLSDGSNLAKLNATNTFSNTNSIQATSTTAFRVQTAAGGSTLFTADTTDGNVKVGTPLAGLSDALQVNGAAYATNEVDVGTGASSTWTTLSQTSLVLNGITVCSVTGVTLTCGANGGFGNYISNQTALQTANFAVQSNSPGSVTGVIEGAASQTADILDVRVAGASSGGALTVNSTGGVLVDPAVSTTAFQIQNAGSTSNLFVADTQNSKIGIGMLPSSGGATLQVTGSISATSSVNTNGTFTVSGSQIASTNLADASNLAYLNGGNSGSFQNFTGNDEFSASAGSVPGVFFNNAGSVNVAGGYVMPGVLDRGNSVSSFAIQNSGSGTPDLLNADTADMRLSVDTNITPMAQPVQNNITRSPNGSLTVTTFFYQVTAVDVFGNETPVSLANEKNLATTSGNKTLNISWTAVTGAVYYKVYRGTASGAENKLVATTAATAFTDAGGTTTNATPPTTGNAFAYANSSSNSAQLMVGGQGTPTGQVYVSGTVPSAALSSVSAGASGSNPNGVVVQGKYAYVVNSGLSTFLTVDVSNPASPTTVSTLTLSGTAPAPDGLYVQGHYAYIATSGSGSLEIVDISNPTAPVVVSNSNFGAVARSIYVQGRYAYMTCFNAPACLKVIDVSNPASPTQVSSVSVGTGTYNGLYVQGRYAYVTNGSNLYAFDISNAASPAPVGSLTLASAYGVFVQGRYAYVTSTASTGGVYVVDVSNPASLTLAGSVASGASGTVNSTAVYVQGRYAYVADNQDHMMEVYDVSLPSAPRSLGTVSTGSGGNPSSVFVSGRYAYVTDTTNNDLLIYDTGGAYIQQLEAGGTETGTLTVDSDATIGGDENIQGGLGVGANLQVSGNAGISGSLTLTGISISAPSTPTLSGSGTLGNLPAGTYFYKVASLGPGGNTSVPVASSPTSYTATGSSSKTNISWTAVTGAAGYIVYRSTDNVNWSSYETTNTSLIDDGSPPWASTTLPASASSGGNLNVGGTTKLTGSGDSSTVAGSGVLIQNTANSTNAFEIQNALGTSNLFIADTTNSRIGIGATPANGLLTIGTSSTTTASGGLYFGTDTDLYRSGSGVLSTDGSLIVGAAASAGYTLTVKGHIVTGNGTGTTTATVQSAAGGGASCSVTGNDTSGQITLTTASGAGSGEQCRISFGSSFNTAPHPVISNAGSTDLSLVKPYVTTSLTGGANSAGYFSINFITADVTPPHTYTWNYFNAQ